jgi:hypothetical protein
MWAWLTKISVPSLRCLTPTTSRGVRHNRNGPHRRSRRLSSDPNLRQSSDNGRGYEEGLDRDLD